MTMNIQGLDYNTQREKLLMPEYGRDIQKMIDYACTLPTKQERQRCAETILSLMALKIPKQQNDTANERMLWDHLYLISGKQLDIDYPYDISEAEKILTKPAPLGRPNQKYGVRVRHYGRLVEKMLERLKTMADSPERDELIRRAANIMKYDLKTWGHGGTDDEKVADDLARYTDGAVQLDLSSFRFSTREPRDPFPASPAAGGGKKRKGHKTILS